MHHTYHEIVKAIAITVRFGYRAGVGETLEQVGTLQTPLVDIEPHRHFVRELFRRRANLEGRSQVGFISTNYDTLLEDALALEHRTAIDGFSGRLFKILCQPIRLDAEHGV